MIEAVITVVVTIVEAIVAALASLVEWIGGFFFAGAEALGVGELIGIVLIFCVELVLWVVLGIVELVRAALQWRKPRAVPKPVIWRPAKLRNARTKDDGKTESSQ
jgi:hypothetical protein